MVGLSCYKWYQSQTLDDVPVRTLSPKRSGLWDPTLVGEGNKAFFIRVWKPFPSKHILEPWGWQRYVTGQSVQYLLAVGLDCYILSVFTYPSGYCMRNKKKTAPSMMTSVAFCSKFWIFWFCETIGTPTLNSTLLLWFNNNASDTTSSCFFEHHVIGKHQSASWYLHLRLKRQEKRDKEVKQVHFKEAITFTTLVSNHQMGIPHT